MPTVEMMNVPGWSLTICFKGKKDRYTLLSKKLRKELRTYYRKYRPGTYLFPSRSGFVHMSFFNYPSCMPYLENPVEK